MNNHTKTALITGSGQNIGRGIAHHLAAAFNIIVNVELDRRLPRMLQAKCAIGAAAMVAMGDVGDKVAA